MSPSLLGPFSMIGKKLGNLEEQNNESLMTFSEVKHCQWGTHQPHGLGTDSSGSSAERTWGTAGLFKVVTPACVLGCSGVATGQTLHSAPEAAAPRWHRGFGVSLGHREASTGEQVQQKVSGCWGECSTRHLRRGSEGWVYLSWRR